MLALFRAEMVKQWHRPRTYVALGLTMLIPIITAIALKSNPPALRERDDAFAYLATHTGLFLPVAALRFMSRFLLVIIVVLFAGDAVASEASWGNLRNMLTRPVNRNGLLAAKAESTFVLAAIATALIGITGLIAGGIAFGWHPLDLPVLHGLHESTSQIIGNLAIASIYVLWGMAGVAALAFMASTMTDSPAGAVFAGIGLYIVSQILDGITSLGSIRYALPTHYFDAWMDLFTHPGQGPTADMLRGTLLQIPYVAVFGGVAWWHFRHKDIHS